MSVKMIGEYTEQHLLKVASNTVAKKTLASKIFDPERENRIPKFHIEGKSKKETPNRLDTCSSSCEWQ